MTGHMWILECIRSCFLVFSCALKFTTDDDDVTVYDICFLECLFFTAAAVKRHQY